MVTGGGRIPATHRTHVEFGGERGNQAVCVCGWKSAEGLRKPEAAHEAVRHAREELEK